LINSVFGVKDAVSPYIQLISFFKYFFPQKVSHFIPGEADIYHEITSESNPRFVLHDSKGFEPAKMETFDIVRQFILEKSKATLELKDRLHAVWYILVPLSSASA
jgi:hypothetical protein